MKTVSFKTISKTALLALSLSCLTFAVHSQDKQPKKKKKQKTEQMQMKDHVCTNACKNGQHVYAHGEKGHVCTDACKKMESSNMKK
jgi:hypothetical protein